MYSDYATSTTAILRVIIESQSTMNWPARTYPVIPSCHRNRRYLESLGC